MMKKILLFSAFMCTIVPNAASAATASDTSRVIGAGASTASGDVVINARATVPGTAYLGVPAVGLLKAPNVSGFNATATTDLSGKVTCIGVWLPWAVAVSGTLDTPLVSGGYTYPNFTVLIWGSSESDPGAIQVWADNISAGLTPCGTDLFFSAGQELPEVRAASTVVRGHFVINGTG